MQIWMIPKTYKVCCPGTFQQDAEPSEQNRSVPEMNLRVEDFYMLGEFTLTQSGLAFTIRAGKMSFRAFYRVCSCGIVL